MKQLILPLALIAAACDREEQPQAPTPAESAQLNDAEDMLNGMANEESAPEKAD